MQIKNGKGIKTERKTENMKKILYFVAAVAATTLITSTGISCRFAPEQQDGDTVAASEFYPEDRCNFAPANCGIMPITQEII